MPEGQPTPLNYHAPLMLGKSVQFLRKSPLQLTDEDQLGHILIAGNQASGADHLTASLLQQQTARGGGWVVMADARNSLLVEGLESAARSAGRSKEFQLLDFSHPDGSTYSPVHKGRPSDMAEHLMQLLPEAPDSPGADFYRNTARHALKAILSALQDIGQPVTLLSLSKLLAASEQLKALAESIHEQNPEHDLLNLVGAFQKRRNDVFQIDRAKVTQLLSGIAGRIAQLAQGKLGLVLNTTQPTIDLNDVVSNRRMLLVKFIPSCAGSMAAALRRMLAVHLESAMLTALDTNSVRANEIPFIIASDHPGASSALLSNKSLMLARGLRISFLLRAYSLDEIRDCSAEASRSLMENTASKLFFGWDSIGDRGIPDEEYFHLPKLVARQKQGEFHLLRGTANVHGRLTAAK